MKRPAMNPRAQTKAANGRRSQRGRRTPERRQTAAAPSATSEGEIANQSTDGVWIMERAPAELVLRARAFAQESARLSRRARRTVRGGRRRVGRGSRARPG